MTALLSLIGPQAVAILVGIVALLGVYIKGRMDKGKLETAKQAAGKLRAAEDRIEMDREATAFERRAAQLSDEEARKEATKWAKPR